MSTTEFQEGLVYNGEHFAIKGDGSTTLLKVTL
jgi:hypothetical protein